MDTILDDNTIGADKPIARSKKLKPISRRARLWLIIIVTMMVLKRVIAGLITYLIFAIRMINEMTQLQEIEHSNHRNLPNNYKK